MHYEALSRQQKGEDILLLSVGDPDFDTPAVIVNVPMRPETEFHLDVNDIEAAITAKTKVIFINSPHNPSGSIVSIDEWQRIAKLCIKHDIWLMIGEVYSAITYNNKYYSPAVIDGMQQLCCCLCVNETILKEGASRIIKAVETLV